MARDLITRGAGIGARNWRGAEPLHAAVTGVPGSVSWNPARRRDVIVYLIEAGADPGAAAAGRDTTSPGCPEPMSGCCRGPPARRCRSSPPKRPRLDRIRPRSPDNRARRHGLRRGQGRTANHHRTTREHHRVDTIVRDFVVVEATAPRGPSRPIRLPRAHAAGRARVGHFAALGLLRRRDVRLVTLHIIEQGETDADASTSGVRSLDRPRCRRRRVLQPRPRLTLRGTS